MTWLWFCLGVCAGVALSFGFLAFLALLMAGEEQESPQPHPNDMPL